MVNLLEVHKKKFLEVFPKVTSAGSSISYAGFSSENPPKSGTVHVSQLACFSAPAMGASTDLVRTEVGFLRSGGLHKSIQVTAND